MRTHVKSYNPAIIMFVAVIMMFTIVSGNGIALDQNSNDQVITTQSPDIEKVKQMRQKQAMSNTYRQLLNGKERQLNMPVQKKAEPRIPNRIKNPFPANTETTRPIRSSKTAGVVTGSGIMQMNSDSVYFNFATGMPSGDSTGMDLQITGNEGVNFGNEGWNGNPAFPDPSMLFYLSPDSTMATVTMVPMVDDTAYTWTDVSWDWQGGNGGQPLAPGNVWVVYTRTTNCYVVLQVTDVGGAWDSGFFTFDYMYQPDGSNIFDGSPVDYLDAMINFVDSDTVVQGTDITLTVDFSTGCTDAYVYMWIDMDSDGILDYDVDYELDMDDHIYIVDNDMDDEDPE